MGFCADSQFKKPCNSAASDIARPNSGTDTGTLLVQLITHSSSLPYMVPTLVLSLLCYNIAGMFVTDEIGAVARTVLETMRTLFVWMVDLLLYYTPLGLGRLGEKWDNYSYLQAVGYAALPVTVASCCTPSVPCCYCSFDKLLLLHLCTIVLPLLVQWCPIYIPQLLMS